VTNETDSFVQEVDESLRQDRVLQFFKSNGIWILAALIAVVVGIGIWQGWRWYATSTARAHSDQYLAAQQMLSSGNLDGAKVEFERLRDEGPQHFRTMARMEHGAVLQAQGDLEAALTEFDAAAEAARDPMMRETAQLRAAYIAAETQDLAAMQTRLLPLIEGEGRVSYLARELLAIEAWEGGDLDLARQTLESLALAFDAPETVRQRAQVALAVVGPAPASSSTEGAAAPAPSEGETK
jgi:hypothetical protein